MGKREDNWVIMITTKTADGQPRRSYLHHPRGTFAVSAEQAYGYTYKKGASDEAKLHPDWTPEGKVDILRRKDALEAERMASCAEKIQPPPREDVATWSTRVTEAMGQRKRVALDSYTKSQLSAAVCRRFIEAGEPDIARAIYDAMG